MTQSSPKQQPPNNNSAERDKKPVFLGSVKGKLLALLVTGFMVLTIGNFGIVAGMIFVCLGRTDYADSRPMKFDSGDIELHDRRSSEVSSTADICVEKGIDQAQVTLKESFVVLLSMWSGVVALKKDREDD